MRGRRPRSGRGVIRRTRCFERGKIQVVVEFDEQMFGIAFEKRQVSLVAQPDEQWHEVDFEDGKGKIGYNRQGGLSCAKDCWWAPQSSHILRPLSSSCEFSD